MMDVEEFSERRRLLGEFMRRESALLQDFGALNTRAYAEGDIPKKYKELIGLVISIVSRCEECVLFQLQELKRAQGGSREIVEAIELAVVGAGSVVPPCARSVLRYMQKFGFEFSIRGYNTTLRE